VEARQKFKSTVITGFFVGYEAHSSFYMIYFPDTGKVFSYRDVVFNEQPLLNSMKRRHTLLHEKVLNWSDDILIFSKTPEEHVKHVETVLNIIKEHGFFLKLSKCEFFQTSITYLGHLINCDGIMPDPKKLSAVKGWPTPKSILDVRSFLGLANYFRRYVKSFSEIAVPLINLTKGNVSRRQSSTSWIVWTKNVNSPLTR
jgi:hypothetical protein